MENFFVRQRFVLWVLMTAFVVGGAAFGDDLRAEPQGKWISLFDGRSLDGWKATENGDTWRVEDGRLVVHGPPSQLFYAGPAVNHDFRNFELEAELRTCPGSRAGLCFHTQYRPGGLPAQGHIVLVNNSDAAEGSDRLPTRTGTLAGVRNIYSTSVKDDEWFRLRVRVAGNRICVWVNDHPTVDYLQLEDGQRRGEHAPRVLSRGTIALQAPDAGGRVLFRRLAIRLLEDDEGPAAADRASDEGYGLKEGLVERFAAAGVPVIDYHVHLRGGMTIEKAMDRQAVTGISVGVLRNLGRGWPLETDDQLCAFLDSVEGKPVFAGVQVNDRDWMHRHSPALLRRLDFVLGDTMIMPMPDDDSEPVKLWMTDLYTIDDPEAWMRRYVRHNLRVLAEPITILANPTYLPPAVKDRYDDLWTDDRMRQVIRAAIDNRVALEINATSGLPSDRFIRLAKQRGAKFTFGSNNFDDRPMDMSRCFEAIDRYGLTRDDMYVPVPGP